MLKSCLGWRDIAYWWGPGGGAAEIAQGPRAEKLGRGPLIQDGTSAGPNRAEPRGCRTPAFRPHPPAPAHLWRRHNLRAGKQSRKKFQQGPGSQSNKCPPRLSRYCWSRAGKQGLELRANNPSLSPASAPPHSLCHTTLFSPFPSLAACIFPNAVEEQPPPPSQPPAVEREFRRTPPFAAGTAPPTYGSRHRRRHGLLMGFPPNPGLRLRSVGEFSVGNCAPPSGRLSDEFRCPRMSRK